MISVAVSDSSLLPARAPGDDWAPIRVGSC